MTSKPTYTFTPSVDGLRAGVVTIHRPLTTQDLLANPDLPRADLFETGPMWRVRYEHGPAGFSDAYLGELLPIDGAPEAPWGDWWDAEDHLSSGAVQHYIETGERITRRDAFEHSMNGGRILLAAEAITRRAAFEGVTA